ncbi:MAG: hypothetical protein C4558_04645 [Dehalococcoidia bacterium]|nr:MAG: hypothetical protein C4558_04645 [Dehalococcoidia bacterium]
MTASKVARLRPGALTGPGLLAVVAGLAAAAITVVYTVIMARQRDSGDALGVSLITATFASSAVTLIAGARARQSKARVALLTWGATVALFWTLLLNTLTPLWLPVAILGWIAAVRAARSFSREVGSRDGWVVLGGTWVVCVAVLAAAVFGSIASDRSPSGGSGEGIAAPR